MDTALMAELHALVEDAQECSRAYCGSDAVLVVRLGEILDDGGSRDRDLPLCLDCSFSMIALLLEKGRLTR